MDTQTERIEALIPGILVTQSIGYDERESRGNCVSSVFWRPDAAALAEECKSLERELNCAVAPDVVIGKITTGALHATIPSMANRALPLPMAYADAAALYRELDPSLVGVELRGDVLDTDLRRSHEILASRVELPSCLRNFEFPEEVQKLHERLCPSAESIRVEPYKILFYGPGDFFVPHRDSMEHEDMFGTISLGLPISARMPQDTVNETEKAGQRPFSVPSDGFDSDYGERLGEPGQLILYVGYRESDVTAQSIEVEHAVSKENMLTYVVDMESVVSTSVTSADDLSIAMSYGAWTGDVLHEVRRIDEGYRAVLTYKLYKQGHRESYIPAALRTSVEQQVSKLVSGLAQVVLPEQDREGKLPEHFYLGFSLRHAYPPVALLPRCLKGIDAIVHSIVSRLYETVLFTGFTVRDAQMYERHRLPDRPYNQVVHVTKARPAADLNDEGARDDMARAYPVVANTLWVTLGFGTVLGGGFCYGNADCGTDYWYRQAYLLVGPKK